MLPSFSAIDLRCQNAVRTKNVAHHVQLTSVGVATWNLLVLYNEAKNLFMVMSSMGLSSHSSKVVTNQNVCNIQLIV